MLPYLKLFAWLALLQLCTTSAITPPGWETMTEGCKEKMFPITVGGIYDEFVNCTIQDETNELIIVAGKTTSPNFGPAENPHGFIYAVDYVGNWAWGYFFYNQSTAMGPISGCKFDENHDLLIFGQSDGRPYVMRGNPSNKMEVRQFLTLEPVLHSKDEQPEDFVLFHGIHHDPLEKMYYMAFNYGKGMFVVKVDAGVEMRVVQSVNVKFTNDTDNPQKDINVPRFLVEDPSDNGYLFLMGQYQYEGSVIRLSKSSLKSSWIMKLNSIESGTVISDIMSYVIPQDTEDIYGCGYAWLTPEKLDSIGTKASFFGMEARGSLNFVFQLGDSQAASHGVCRSITHDRRTNELVAMIETNTVILRPFFERYSGSGAIDTLLLKFTTNGLLKNAYNINNDKGGQSIDLSYHSGLYFDSQFIWGAQSLGYRTMYQNLIDDFDNGYFDAHLFKFNPNQKSQCLYSAEINSRDLKSNKNTLNEQLVQDFKSNKYIFTSANNRFKAYDQNKIQLVKGFELLSKWKLPRLCSQKGAQLPDAQYFLNTPEITYAVQEKNATGAYVLEMNNGQYWMTANGTNVNGVFGKWDQYDQGGSFKIYTTNQSIVGDYSTILRGCSQTNELIELGLKLSIKANNGPAFKTQLQTTFEPKVGEVLEYFLPTLYDPEGNDLPEVYIDYQQSTEFEFPPYMFYNNITKSLTFRPHIIWYQGVTFVFDIIIKEQSSNNTFQRFPCNVKVPGNVIDPQEYYNYTDIQFEIKRFQKDGEGFLRFSQKLNTTFIVENWDKLFWVYYQNSTYMKTGLNSSDLKFTILGHHNDNLIHFKVNFDEPYYIAVMETRPSKLFIHLRFDILDVYGRINKPEYESMVYGNVSLNRFFYEEVKVDAQFGVDNHYEGRLLTLSSKECPKMFDFDNKIMYYFRQFAVKVYWYLGGFIIVQTVIVFKSRITTLPLWTFLEFMQMYSYLPLLHFNLFPFIYDIFKPFLTSHLILTNETLMMLDYQDKFFGPKYEEYTLSIAKMGQSLFLYAALFVVIIVANILTALLYVIIPSKSSAKVKVGGWLLQFKFNAYIKYYQLSYLDLTYCSMLKLQQADTTAMDRQFTLFSYFILCLNIALPLCFCTIVMVRFQVLPLKEFRQKFSMLYTGLDKGKRIRLFPVFYFFFRRLVYCYCMANESLQLRYTFIIIVTVFGPVWTCGLRPYKTLGLNMYMGSMELLYFFCLIFFIVFTDILPYIPTKIFSSFLFFCVVVLVMIVNLVYSLYLNFIKRDIYKQQVVDFKRQRVMRDFEWKKAEEDSYQDDIDEINERRAAKGLRVTTDNDAYMVDFVKRSGIIVKLKAQLADQVRVAMKSRQKLKKQAAKRARKSNNADLVEGSLTSESDGGSDHSDGEKNSIAKKRDHEYEYQKFEGDFRAPFGRAALFGRLQELMEDYKKNKPVPIPQEEPVEFVDDIENLKKHDGKKEKKDKKKKKKDKLKNRNNDLVDEIVVEAPDSEVVQRVKKPKTTKQYDIDAYHTSGQPSTLPKTTLDMAMKKKLRIDFDSLLEPKAKDEKRSKSKRSKVDANVAAPQDKSQANQSDKTMGSTDEKKQSQEISSSDKKKDKKRKKDKKSKRDRGRDDEGNGPDSYDQNYLV